MKERYVVTFYGDQQFKLESRSVIVESRIRALELATQWSGELSEQGKETARRWLEDKTWTWMWLGRGSDLGKAILDGKRLVLVTRAVEDDGKPLAW